MMNRKISFLLLLLVLLAGSVEAQKKSPAKEKKELPPPEEVPVQEGIKEEGIDTTAYPGFEKAKIEFDTTAVPEDNFTELIRKLLVVTHARQADIEMAEFSLKQSLSTSLNNPATAPMMQKFYDRFIHEMKEGDAARWIENVYIRNYRSLFTAGEVQQLIDFYSTPTGQKALVRTRQLVQNVSAEAMKIGRYLGEEVMNTILKEENK
jgi:hypothetical protein